MIQKISWFHGLFDTYGASTILSLKFWIFGWPHMHVNVVQLACTLLAILIKNQQIYNEYGCGKWQILIFLSSHGGRGKELVTFGIICDHFTWFGNSQVMLVTREQPFVRQLTNSLTWMTTERNVHHQRGKKKLKKKLPRVRIELTTFRLWDWRAAYCANEALQTKVR